MFWSSFYLLYCFTFHYWHIIVMYFDVQLESCILMLLSFYMYSIACTIVT